MTFLHSDDLPFWANLGRFVGVSVTTCGAASSRDSSSIVSQPRWDALTNAWIRLFTASLCKVDVTQFSIIWVLIPRVADFGGT